ncbi:hypothetical protein Mpt1_c11100 [Candidatus Methanoplasma termitum]|uniref:Uncharacterized protein n=1 Tax=Candidatus Methanoplasma termitum TaxID=1577791 RepID=A0A0A7LHI3_9ARCH|nr:hypothetical protein [Candidatus Methanoplasma termitum]AIZ56976.1 hypothetical protein Mpt1_c11100 [Candidatus Methanoplasma termitum]MCL2333290.1 hypothetical protein [Candidatus Methanoplasma sp.]
MRFKVPDEEVVSQAINKVMTKNNHIETQTEFLRLVRKELSKLDEDYRVSGERIRRIGLDNNLIKITIEYRESDIKDLPHICPVCRNAMSPVMNRSLEGEYVEIKRKCSVCPYTIGKTVLVPGRYVFSRAKNNDLSQQELSVRKLKKAGAKIKEAMGLIEEALKGTDLEERGSELVSDLKEMVDSPELAISIKNISLDMKQSGKDPIWTRPTVSIKNSEK